MGAPIATSRYTIDQYLAMEREAEERHIFLDGATYPMAGESDAHGIITVNLVGILGMQLKGKCCQIRTKGAKVRSVPVPLDGSNFKGMFTYPDVMGFCDAPEFHDAFTDVILNPRVIVEVFSPASERFDRGERFHRYQAHNATLQEYVLVSQDRARVESFERKGDGSWTYRHLTGLDETWAIPSIGCTLHLVDVYDRVCFPADPIT